MPFWVTQTVKGLQGGSGPGCGAQWKETGSWPDWVGLLGALGRVIVTAMMAPNT